MHYVASIAMILVAVLGASLVPEDEFTTSSLAIVVALVGLGLFLPWLVLRRGFPRPSETEIVNNLCPHTLSGRIVILNPPGKFFHQSPKNFINIYYLSATGF